MNNTVPLLPVPFVPVAGTPEARLRELDARAQVAHLFRKRGDSEVMRSLEQSLLAYRLEQRR